MGSKSADAIQLVDIRNISIDMLLPCKERKRRYIEQVGDPYHFRYKNIIVSVSFSGTDTLENKVITHLKKQAQILG